jgi:hypothetical protein
LLIHFPGTKLQKFVSVIEVQKVFVTAKPKPAMAIFKKGNNDLCNVQLPEQVRIRLVVDFPVLKIGEFATEAKKPNSTSFILFDLQDLIVWQTIVDAEISEIFTVKSTYPGIRAYPDVAFAILETEKASITW